MATGTTGQPLTGCHPKNTRVLLFSEPQPGYTAPYRLKSGYRKERPSFPDTLMGGKKLSNASGPEKSESKLRSVLAITRRMNSERDPSALLELMAREATRLMDADRASIFLLDEKRSELLSRVALGSTEVLHFDARLGIAGAAALNNQIINVHNAQEDPRFYPQIDSVSGYRTCTVLAVPMRDQQNQVVGTFEVLNKQSGTFTSKDEEILETLARQAAIALHNARSFQKLRDENTILRRKSATQSLLGTSLQIQRIVRLIDTISDSSVNVLIRGESGTGKELVAKAVHSSSPRAHAPFVAVNSAALPESLLEPELFGIEKGVATGVEPRSGKFEEAHGGTLFLDEVGDLSLGAQAKILRAVQEQVIERVGGRKSIPVDVRILAATHRDLEKAIEEGEFREDLYYRLKVVEMRMPALRDVPGDIPLLAHHFLSRHCRTLGKDPKELSAGAVRRLLTHRWPGNVRELENEIERLVVSVRRRVIQAEDLMVGQLLEDATQDARPAEPASLKETVGRVVAELETSLITEALARHDQNRKRTALALGLSRQGLLKKMKRYGIS